jgi:histone H3/H4
MQSAQMKTSIAQKSPRKKSVVVTKRDHPIVTPTLEVTCYARPETKRTPPKKKRRAIRMTDKIIPRITFERVVREILAKQSPSMRIKRSAVNILHEETENFIHKMFTDIKSVSDSQDTSLITTTHMKLVYALTGIKAPPPIVVKKEIVTIVTPPLEGDNS